MRRWHCIAPRCLSVGRAIEPFTVMKRCSLNISNYSYLDVVPLNWLTLKIKKTGISPVRWAGICGSHPTPSTGAERGVGRCSMAVIANNITAREHGKAIGAIRTGCDRILQKRKEKGGSTQISQQKASNGTQGQPEPVTNSNQVEKEKRQQVTRRGKVMMN